MIFLLMAKPVQNLLNMNYKLRNCLIFLILFLCLLSSSFSLKAFCNQEFGDSINTMYYDPDFTTNFMNPERGWHKNIDFINGGSWSTIRTNHNMTLARTYVRLDNFRDKPLPEDFLAKHTQRFNELRQAGIKIVLRYSYNFGFEPDAPLEIVLQHISQLAPYWQQNADVIMNCPSNLVTA